MHPVIVQAIAAEHIKSMITMAEKAGWPGWPAEPGSKRPRAVRCSSSPADLVSLARIRARERCLPS
jgi:hypothetical protein